MSYKFDGKNLKYSSRTIANVRGNNICEGSGSRTIANIRNNNICQGSGSSTLANVRGRNICERSGSSKIATMDQVDKVIDGPGGVTKAALWYMFVK